MELLTENQENNASEIAKYSAKRKEQNAIYYAKVKENLKQKRLLKESLKPPKEIKEKIKKELTEEEKEQKKISKKEWHAKYYNDKLNCSVICDHCGHEYFRSNKSRHLKSKKHKEKMSNSICEEIGKVVIDVLNGKVEMYNCDGYIIDNSISDEYMDKCLKECEGINGEFNEKKVNWDNEEEVHLYNCQFGDYEQDIRSFKN